MRVAWELVEGDLVLRMRLDSGEKTSGVGQGGAVVSLMTDSCRFRVPDGSDLPGPDLAALAAFTVCLPWVGDSITFDRAISVGLAEAFWRFFDIRCGPVDSKQRQRSSGSFVGLSYSGGADSIAVGEVLPDASPYVHLRRIPHPRVPNRATHFRSDVIAQLVAEAGNRGRRVTIVESDLEYIVLPYPTYPQWPTVGIGSVLMADTLDLGGLAFGTNLGSGYLRNGYRYQGPPREEKWNEIFSAVGLPFVRPACGMTEVSTIRIAQESDLADITRSCSLGPIESPCMNCSKCLRKDLTLAAIEGRPLDPQLFQNLNDDHPAVVPLMQPPPYYFQHILEYSLARAEGIDGTFLETAKRYLAPAAVTTEWAERFYSPAVDEYVDEKWRAPIVNQLWERFQPMSDEETRIVQSWDAASRTASQERG